MSQTTLVNFHGLDIVMVGTYKYLGVHLNKKMDSMDALYKKKAESISIY